MSVLRKRESTGVGPVELFFDLVYALALIGFALPVRVLAALALAVLMLLSLAGSGWFRLPTASVE